MMMHSHSQRFITQTTKKVGKAPVTEKEVVFCCQKVVSFFLDGISCGKVELCAIKWHKKAVCFRICQFPFSLIAWVVN